MDRDVELHVAALEEACRLDDAYFEAHPERFHHRRQAVDHEVCVALRGGEWCRDPRDDMPPPPDGMERIIVVLVTRSAGADGSRTKQFGGQLVPIGQGAT